MSQLPYLHFTGLLAETCPRHPIIMLEARHVSMRLHARVRHTSSMRQLSCWYWECRLPHSHRLSLASCVIVPRNGMALAWFITYNSYLGV